jgi:hypothetical protein
MQWYCLAFSRVFGLASFHARPLGVVWLDIWFDLWFPVLWGRDVLGPLHYRAGEAETAPRMRAPRSDPRHRAWTKMTRRLTMLSLAPLPLVQRLTLNLRAKQPNVKDRLTQKLWVDTVNGGQHG